MVVWHLSPVVLGICMRVVTNGDGTPLYGDDDLLQVAVRSGI